MGKVKYAAGLTPLLNKHFGAVFQPNHTNQTMKSDSSGARSRWENQTQKQQGLMKAIRCWRNMSEATKANWNNFASAYPQASRRNPAIFLTGYQLFLKRNHYCFLNHGIDCDFMTEPELTELAEPNIELSLVVSDNSIDVTENYIANFGIIPQIGQFVLIKVFPMSESSGQFFAPIEQIIEVTESYIDGLFVSLAFTSNIQDITFSVYLSKVIHQSTQYVGTKVRYMGCFTPKTFKALTDTPDDYAGQSGKVPAVKETEDGLEFIDPPSGGISCEDLIDCPLIIQMLNSIDTLAIIAANSGVSSVPALHFGLLYSGYIMVTPSPITSDDAWQIMDSPTFDSIITYLNGLSLAGGPLKDTNLDYWNSPNSGATNSALTNLRAAGSRSYSGLIRDLKKYNTIWSSTYYASTYSPTYKFTYLSTSVTKANKNKREANSIRLFKSAVGIPDGTFTTYIGNNGIVYRAVAINGFYVLADSLAETLYRDLTSIPVITDNTEWNNNRGPALCPPNLDFDNV